MSETRLVRRDELLQGDKGGGFRGRQPNACFLDAAICAGLRPADVLVYVKRSQGRENRPYKKRSTVDAKSDAFCKSCSAPKRQTKSLRYHCTTVAHSSNPLPWSFYPFFKTDKKIHRGMYLWHSGIRRSSIVRAIDDDIRPIYTEKDSAAISTTTSSACF